MTYDYPSYYSQFHCIGGSCPDSCCIGWEVDIDEETYNYYKSLKGPFGDRLRAHIKEDGADRYFPLCEGGRCPFLNRENLCDIITQLGEESLAQVCMEYPRYFLEKGDYEQIDLSLSCMELGRIFFEDPDPIEYIREEMPDADADANPIPDTALNGRLVHVLDIRDDCIAILEDRSRTLADRFLEVLHLYGPGSCHNESPGMQTSPNHTDCAGDQADGIRLTRLPALFEQMSRLEVLDSRWTDLLTEMRLQFSEYPDGSLPDVTIAEFVRQPLLWQELSQCARGKLAVWFEKLGCYFCFRYITDSCFQPARHTGAGITAPAIHFCAKSVCFLYLMCISRYLKSGKHFGIQDMIDLAHLYSREVEHSDENVEYLKNC
ncbi:flagellin lysine-N-methylase [Porcincola sp. LCP21S3_C12]|uniref:flagellin lysine-N-methylase n=1 Tax=Porcincola sp. LCP21S3_C12 TaxID=3438798 RepID=UPI003F9587FB